ncbi:MAG: Gfo/Idh/MocA family oxidoreductase [Clostridia bacterium]|nr:Gfo/Idh/MocA family oxidoreductase [Clostridia bacterium]
MNKLKVVQIGLGGRGYSLYEECLKYRKDTDFVGFCDVEQSRAEQAAETAVAMGYAKPAVYVDYKKCLDECKPDVALVTTSWLAHVEICMYAMEKGIAVGSEVGGSYTIQQLWEMIRCYERTKTPIMFLENCCYGRIELLALNMKRLGLLGEIVHCEGGYRHDLRAEVAKGVTGEHYRFQEYLHRNGDNYPTHDIGPIAMLLDINRGNCFTHLYSMSSKAVGMAAYAEKTGNEQLRGVKFNQGDVVTTLIKCQNGETVTLTLDTTLPRYYSRGFLVQGTNGILSEDCDGALIEDVVGCHQRKKCLGNVEELYKKYEHPLWQKEYERVNGHGGIDERVLDEFFSAVKEGREMPIDVYDMATWMCITTLSEQSIATGQSVPFPDFTNGAWVRRKNNFAK